MRQKKLKELRRLANYSTKEVPVYKVKSHGTKEKLVNAPIVNPQTGQKLDGYLPVSYKAYTVFNETKAKYKIAKKAYKRLRKTFKS